MAHKVRVRLVGEKGRVRTLQPDQLEKEMYHGYVESQFGCSSSSTCYAGCGTHTVVLSVQTVHVLWSSLYRLYMYCGPLCTDCTCPVILSVQTLHVLWSLCTDCTCPVVLSVQTLHVLWSSLYRLYMYCGPLCTDCTCTVVLSVQTVHVLWSLCTDCACPVVLSVQTVHVLWSLCTYVLYMCILWSCLYRLNICTYCSLPLVQIVQARMFTDTSMMASLMGSYIWVLTPITLKERGSSLMDPPLPSSTPSSITKMM